MSADKIFKYGELEVKCSPTDYVQQKNVEVAMRRMKETVSNIDGALENSARLKVMVEAVERVFDDVFGESSANKALGVCTDLEEAMDAINALAKHMQANAERVSSKYEPGRRKG